MDKSSTKWVIHGQLRSESAIVPCSPIIISLKTPRQAKIGLQMRR
jgi:hypothetical protein